MWTGQVNDVPLLMCRGTHEDYDRQGYSFRLAKQTVADATITEVVTLPVCPWP
jgi:hypothetical protein